MHGIIDCEPYRDLHHPSQVTYAISMLRRSGCDAVVIIGCADFGSLVTVF
jgi:hypothetical protein